MAHHGGRVALSGLVFCGVVFTGTYQGPPSNSRARGARPVPTVKGCFLFLHPTLLLPAHSRGRTQAALRALICYIQSFASAKCCWSRGYSEDVVVARLSLDPPALLQGELSRPLTGQSLHLRLYKEHIGHPKYRPFSETTN